MGRLSVDSKLVLVCGMRRAALALPLFVAMSGWAAGQTAPARTPPVVGTIKSIDGATMTVTTDAGTESKVTVSETTKLLRVPPGSKDLSQAVAIPLTEFQPGDRVLASVRCAGDASPCEASRVIAMKKADISDKQAQEREAWRRGIGGLVKSVDAAQGAITIGTVTGAGKKDVAVEAGKNTIVRRYAPGSVKFEDAKPSSVAAIQTGDQLRAWGAQRGWGKFCRGRDCDRVVSEYCGHYFGGGCRSRNDFCDRSGDEKNRTGKGKPGYAAEKIAGKHGTNDCDASKRRHGGSARWRSGRPG